YEYNLVPLVEPGKGSSHPHLYDRLVSSGAPPDFPRPEPPPTRGRQLAVALSLALLLVAWLNLLFVSALLPTTGHEQSLLLSLACGGHAADTLSALGAQRLEAKKFAESAVFFQAASESDTSSPFHPANRAVALSYRMADPD